MRTMFFIAIIAVLSACSNGQQTDHSEQSKSTPTTVSRYQVPHPIRGYSDSQICRAIIATVMGRDVGITMATWVDEDNLFVVSYVRPSDQKVWHYQCRITPDGKGHWGASGRRWREPVEIVVSRGDLLITDPISGPEMFSPKDFHD